MTEEQILERWWNEVMLRTTPQLPPFKDLDKPYKDACMKTLSYSVFKLNLAVENLGNSLLKAIGFEWKPKKGFNKDGERI